MYFNIAKEIHERHQTYFEDDIKTYVGRATRRRGKTYEEMVKKARKSKSGVFSDEVRKKFGTIYTPEFVVDKTLDLAFKYLPEGADPLQLTWCDPAAGDGNFLINLYYRLMKCPSDMDPIEKSEHILTKCIYGMEILKNMWFSCKIRLFMAHAKTMKENSKEIKRGYCDIMERFNIFHGNTIMVPEDVGKWEIDERQEGGLLEESVRNMKYDVIIGNPPYTHLRNLKNRRYHSYPKQRDMAQVFVRWALDHLTEKGVCSYNTSDAWLNVKLSDGAKETRKLVSGKIREICQENAILTYSEGDGGDINTFIICFDTNNDYALEFKNISTTYNMDTILKPGFVKQLIPQHVPYKHVNVGNYISKLIGHKSKKSNKESNEIYNNIVCFEDPDSNSWYLVCKRIIGCRVKNGLSGTIFKIICSDNIKSTMNMFSSELKYGSVESKQYAMWTNSFLNSKYGIEQLKLTLRNCQTAGHSDPNDWLIMVASGTFSQCRVPDFDWYKENRPEQFNSYMKWIEENMRDKDKFLAGIDEQFERLINA